MNDPKIPRSVNKYIVTSTPGTVTVTLYFRPYLDGLDPVEEPIHLNAFVFDKTIARMIALELHRHCADQGESPRGRT